MSEKAIPKLESGWHHLCEDYVHGLATSPTGKQVAAVSADGRLTVLDTHSGQVTIEVDAHQMAARCLDWSVKDILATGGEDGFVNLWSPNGERLSRIHVGGWVESMRWSRDGQWLFAIAGRQPVVIDAQGRRHPPELNQAHTLAALCLLPDDDHGFATASYQQLRYWRAGDPQPTRQLEWQGSMLSLSISPNHRFVATGAQDKSVHLWDLRKNDDLYLAGFATKVLALDWSHDGRWLLTGGGSGVIRWDCSGEGPSGRDPLNLPIHLEPVSVIRCHTHRPIVLSGGREGMVLQTGIDDGWVQAGIAQEGEVSCLHWHPDGQSFFAAWGGGAIVHCHLHPV
jgi:WD40 repeat protein